MVHLSERERISLLMMQDDRQRSYNEVRQIFNKTFREMKKNMKTLSFRDPPWSEQSAASMKLIAKFQDDQYRRLVKKNNWILYNYLLKISSARAKQISNMTLVAWLYKEFWKNQVSSV